MYDSVDTWDSQILGNPVRHLITGITGADCPPKTSRRSPTRTPFCHNFNSTAIMTMINWPVPVCVSTKQKPFLNHLMFGGSRLDHLWTTPTHQS